MKWRICAPVFGAGIFAPDPRSSAGAQSDDAFDVLPRRVDHVDGGIGVVRPVRAELMDAEAGPLCAGEQLRVEEPLGVLDLRQQFLRRPRRQCLEPALGIAESDAEADLEQTVVAAGDDLALDAALDRESRLQAGGDGDIGQSGPDDLDHRVEDADVRGEVDVRIGDDVGRRRLPHAAQCTAAPLLLEADVFDLRMSGRECRGDVGGGIGARIVGDDDRDLGAAGGLDGEEDLDRGGQRGLLVVHRDDEVDGGGRAGGRVCCLRLRLLPGAALISHRLHISGVG
jgi:hypothetical protein